VEKGGGKLGKVLDFSYIVVWEGKLING